MEAVILPPNLGVKGAAFAACEDIVEVFPATERVEGVNEGESTFRDFFLFAMSAIINLSFVWPRRKVSVVENWLKSAELGTIEDQEEAIWPNLDSMACMGRSSKPRRRVPELAPKGQKVHRSIDKKHDMAGFPPHASNRASNMPESQSITRNETDRPNSCLSRLSRD